MAEFDDAPIIEVRNLKKSFGAITAVDDISFEVKRGEIFGFLGPNGAGKSTTIKMLTTLLRQTSGDIRLDGLDPGADSLAVRRKIGIVFQDPSLDDQLTAYENMAIHAALYKVPSAVRKPKIEELLRFVDLWERKDSMVMKFSGGMKRRLEIARGLLHHPTVMFLDEPTLGLDPQTRNQMWEYLHAMNATEGATVFFTTHYMEEAERNAQRVAVIDHGKIVAIGTPLQVRESQGASSLEDAFLKLTGRSIREEDASAADRMRTMARGFERPTR